MTPTQDFKILDMAIKKIKCPNCGKTTDKRAHNAKYCSAVCRQQAYEKRKGIKPYERAKNRSIGVSEAATSPALTAQQQIYSKYYTDPAILQTLSESEIQLIELRKKKKSLMIKFNHLSQKNEQTVKVISGIATLGGIMLGLNSVKDNDSGLETAFKILGIPTFFMLAGKNITKDHFDNPSEISKINNVKLEIAHIDERITYYELMLINEKTVRKTLPPISQAPMIERTESYTAIDAEQMKDIKRTVYKLTDKWKYFLGDIEQNFTALIHGQPKQGKSHFAIQFAQYLHAKFGDVVYFAAEEGASKNMETKLTRWGAQFKIVYNILGTKGIEDYIRKYKPKFVFIDSISRLRLSADNINFFVDEYIDTSWIMVSQSTKHKSHKGSQELIHIVDSIIHVDTGIAHQEGRTIDGPTQLEVFTK